MKKLRTIIASAVLASGITSLGSLAEAARVSCDTLKPRGTFSATIGLSDAVAAECFNGINDTAAIVSGLTVFGKTGWMFSDKNEAGGPADGPVQWATAPVIGQKSGAWSINMIPAGKEVFLTLKEGNGFGAFLINTTSGSWDSTKNLSHASIFIRDLAAVPLPAGGLLLLSALGFAGMARRRKSR